MPVALDIERRPAAGKLITVKVLCKEDRQCIQGIDHLCGNGIGALVIDKAVIDDGKELVIHFRGEKVPESVIDEIDRMVAGNKARATVRILEPMEP